MSTALGFVLLALWIVVTIAIAAVVTWAVVKVFPAERKPREGPGEATG